MKLLIIKMSSMGDIIHTLSALTAAKKAIPSLKADWVAEEAFVEIPAWHPAVEQVIPIALRRWGRSPLQAVISGEWRRCYRQLRQQHYDMVLDAQGLIKSSLITRLCRGWRIGLDKRSLWEPLARLNYQQHCTVNPEQHAVIRVNQLFSAALNYQYDETVDYGLTRQQFMGNESPAHYLLFLHGTSWATKQWPDHYWLNLAEKATQAGYTIRMGWGNLTERTRAEKIAAACQAVTVLPQMGLTKMATVIAQAEAVVAVDTGLGHLAAALSVPTLSLYGPTQRQAVGTLGKQQMHQSSPVSCHQRCRRHFCHRSSRRESVCLAALTPDEVWKQLEQSYLKS